MTPEIKKKMRPISAPFGILDNCEPRTLLKPNEKSPKSPISDKFFPNKFVNLLIIYGIVNFTSIFRYQY